MLHLGRAPHLSRLAHTSLRFAWHVDGHGHGAVIAWSSIPRTSVLQTMDEDKGGAGKDSRVGEKCWLRQRGQGFNDPKFK